MRSHVRGVQALLWVAVRGRRPPSTWTVADIADDTGVSVHTVRHYVRALVKAGLVRIVEPSRATQSGNTPIVYRCNAGLGPLVPLVRGEGGQRIAFDPNSRLR